MINILLLPNVSAITPLGISTKTSVISRIEYNKPISTKLKPLSKKNNIRKASKNLRFFKKPYRLNLKY